MGEGSLAGRSVGGGVPRQQVRGRGPSPVSQWGRGPTPAGQWGEGSHAGRSVGGGGSPTPTSQWGRGPTPAGQWGGGVPRRQVSGGRGPTSAGQGEGSLAGNSGGGVPRRQVSGGRGPTSAGQGRGPSPVSQWGRGPTPAGQSAVWPGASVVVVGRLGRGWAGSATRCWERHTRVKTELMGVTEYAECCLTQTFPGSGVMPDVHWH